MDNEKLLTLSEMLTEMPQPRALALRGLKMEVHEFNRHFANNPKDISSAVFGMLRTWRTSQPDEVVAYTKMCQALKDTKMESLITKALV